MLRRSVALLLAACLLSGGLPLAAQAPPSSGSSNEPVADRGLFEKSLEAAYHAHQAYGELDEPDELDRVLSIGYELAQKSRFKDFPFTFYLVEMPIPNAFALPGGQIFVTRGMLDLDLDDDMLACLLGHEISHVTERHGTRLQKRATLVNLLSQALIIGAIAGTDNKSRQRSSDPYSIYGIRTDDGSRGDIVQGTAAVSLVLGQLLLLSHSREFETEADDEGQRLAAAAGYDPDGARRLWQRMLERIPQQKAFGYWRTHPFEDSRMRAAEERTKYLKVMPQSEPDAFRQETQERLLAFAEDPETEPEILSWIEATALGVWPQGPTADRLRLKALEDLKEEAMEASELNRDYGALAEAYEEHLAEVAALTPESPFLAEAKKELEALRAESRALYPKAVEVLDTGVFQTSFLESFVSNYPQAPQLPRASLALGEAYSRLSQEAEAVEQFIAVLEKAPGSEEAKRARLGLRNLTEFLEKLSALEQLARLKGDEELQQLARQRLVKMAGTYGDLANGADYLKRFPEGEQAEAVTARLNVLAENLYTEVLVYQGVGDHAKALERMNKILAYAPLSPAADQLREHTTLES